MRRAVARRSTRNAIRIRRHIERKRLGRKVYALELDEVNVEEMLIHEGLLAPGIDHDHKVVVAALAEFISRISALMKYSKARHRAFFEKPPRGRHPNTLARKYPCRVFFCSVKSPDVGAFTKSPAPDFLGHQQKGGAPLFWPVFSENAFRPRSRDWRLIPAT